MSSLRSSNPVIMPARSSAITPRIPACRKNAASPRVGRDVLVAHERAVLAQMSHVYSKAILSVVEGNHVAIHWIFELTDKSGQVRRFDEVSLQEWRGDRIFRERFFYDPTKIVV
jgi:ketosteroid isomerase-like protein